MSAVPFGEIAERLLAGATGDDFAWLVLADHLDEIGHPTMARLIRDGHTRAFRMIHWFLSEKGFDPVTMKLDVQYRVRGKWRVDSGWIDFLTFYTGEGYPCGRVAFYRENPTPSFLDPFFSEPCRHRARRNRA